MEVKEINLNAKTMNSLYFLYWLQGLFEIGEVTRLNQKQVNIIQLHLKITIKDHSFISWLDGFLETQKKGVNKELTLIIKEKLAKSFLNITAPSNPLEELLKLPKSPLERRPWDPLPGLPWDTFKLGPIIC